MYSLMVRMIPFEMPMRSFIINLSSASHENDLQEIDLLDE